MENNALSPRVPPGFRFHPTDEELVDYYLRKKVESKSIDLDVIRDVDLYRLEPWDLQEQCRIGHEEQTDWYFFSHKDKKYPTGTRTNRATVAGFWKATGRDKAIYVKLKLIGMRKTLVFYKGRAPNGQKTDWIMHEYRLETNENAPPQEEGWVVCRAFRKRASHVQHVHAHALKRSSLLLLESTSNYYHDHRNTTTALPFSSNNHDHEHGVRGYIDTGTGNAASLQPSLPEMLSRNPHYEYQRAYACKQEEEEEAAVDLESLENLDYPSYNASFMQLPQLESPKLPSSSSSNNNSTTATTNTNNSSCCGSSTAVTNALTTTEQSMSSLLESISMGVLLPGTGTGTGTGTGEAQAQHMTTDWKVLDRLVASQLMDSAAAAAAVHGQIPLHQYNNGGGTTNNSTSLFSSPFPLSLSTESFMSTLLVRQSNKATAESPDCEASSSVCDVHHDDDYIWSAFAP